MGSFVDVPEDPTGLTDKVNEEVDDIVGTGLSFDAEDILTDVTFGGAQSGLDDISDEWGRLEGNVNDEWGRLEGNVSDEWGRLEDNVSEAWDSLEEGWSDLSGAGGSGDSTENAPWGPLQPYLKDYYAQVSDWAKDRGPAPGPTDETSQAWDLTKQRALSGSPLSSMAQGTMARGMMEDNPALAMYAPTASGSMMDQDFNRFFQRASKGIGDEFQNVVMPSIASRFGGAGRTGSGAEKEMTERAMGQYGEMLGNIGTDIYGQERGRQMGAIGGLGSLWGQGAQNRMGYAGMAPSMAAMDYSDIGRLAGVGEQKRGYEQQAYDQPYTDLQRQSGLLQPGLGFSQTTQPTYGNKDMNTALSLASIIAMF
jgi:hypothetical protein